MLDEDIQQIKEQPIFTNTFELLIDNKLKSINANEFLTRYNLKTNEDNQENKIEFEHINVNGKKYITKYNTSNNTVSKILEGINVTNNKVVIQSKNGQELRTNDIVGTGSIIKVSQTINNVKNDDEYIYIIKGDLDGDGKIDLYDIVKLIELVFDKNVNEVWNVEEKLAGETDGDKLDENPNLYDIVRLIEYNFDNKQWESDEQVIAKEVEFEKASRFSEGLAAIQQNDKWGYIDQKGNLVIDCKYEEAESFIGDLACVKQNDKYGYIDKEGNEVVECKYDLFYEFKDGLADVSQNYKVGYIDKEGNEVIECKYASGGYFSEGLAYVLQFDNKYGYIDKQGNIVIEFVYDRAETFSDGLAYVKKDGVLGFINTKGEFIIKQKIKNGNI